jgi:hypothetical protein
LPSLENQTLTWSIRNPAHGGYKSTFVQPQNWRGLRYRDTGWHDDSSPDYRPKFRQITEKASRQGKGRGNEKPPPHG